MGNSVKNYTFVIWAQLYILRKIHCSIILNPNHNMYEYCISIISVGIHKAYSTSSALSMSHSIQYIKNKSVAILNLCHVVYARKKPKLKGTLKRKKFVK
jgi:hypothetical protein